MIIKIFWSEFFLGLLSISWIDGEIAENQVRSAIHFLLLILQQDAGKDYKL